MITSNKQLEKYEHTHKRIPTTNTPKWSEMKMSYCPMPIIICVCVCTVQCTLFTVHIHDFLSSPVVPFLMPQAKTTTKS